jgi:transposase-like protein
VAVVQEASVNGVATRKVDRLVEALGLAGISKDTVSRLCGGLDEQVTAFRQRPLEVAYPTLWLDAKVEQVRAGGWVEHRALVVAYGVDRSGRREVIGFDGGAAETEAFWREFLRGLVRRGLAGVQLVIADAHQGLKAAIAQVLGGPRQRWTVPFLRDALGHCPKDTQQLVGAAIRPSFRAACLEDARRLLGETVAHCQGRVPRSLGCSRRPRPTCWPSTACRPRTARRYGRPTRWSGSTARSAGAPTWSVSVGPAVRGRIVCQAPMLAPRHDSRCRWRVVAALMPSRLLLVPASAWPTSLAC